MKSSLSASQVLRAAVAVLVIGMITAPVAAQDFTLTILHNNDAESQLINLGSGLEDYGGAARFKTVVDNLKADASGDSDGTVLLSSGDNFLAGPELNASFANGVPFFDSQLVEALGYDALAIGNHEFDFGPDILADFITGIGDGVPFLSANLDFSAEAGLQALVDAGRIAASTLVVAGGETIGVIGATTPNLPFISSPRDVIINDDVAGIVQAEIDAMEAMGVNKIIVISHLQGIEEDLDLIAGLSGIDVAIAGGGDELLANDGDLLVPGDEGDVFGPYPTIAVDADGVEVPVVTTSGQLAYVGRLHVTFNAAGEVTAIDDSSGPVRVSGVESDAVDPDPDVQANVVDPVAEFVAGLAATIVGTSDVELDGVRGNVRSIETNEGDLIADALLWQATQLAPDFGVAAPDVALQNGGGIRNDNVLPAGDITELNTFDMLPFGNFLSIVPDIPAQQFKEIMENAVSRVGSGSGTGRFAQVAGFSFKWTPDGVAQDLDEDGNVVTVGTRVVEIKLDDGRYIVADGVLVDDAPAVAVATGDFLARGGDQYPYRGAPFTALGVTDQQTLRNYIVDGLGGVISGAQYPVGGAGRIQERTVGGTLASITETLVALVDGGKLTSRQGKVFNSRVLAATEEIDDGNLETAIRIMGAFANQIREANARGIIPDEYTSGLVEAAKCVMSLLRAQINTASVAPEGSVFSLATGSLADVNLGQNFPNPFSIRTDIVYAVPQQGHVDLRVYDLLGRTVIQLVDREQAEGVHTVTLNADTLPSGSYVYQLRTNGRVSTKMLTVVR